MLRFFKGNRKRKLRCLIKNDICAEKKAAVNEEDSSTRNDTNNGLEIIKDDAVVQDCEGSEEDDFNLDEDISASDAIDSDIKRQLTESGLIDHLEFEKNKVAITTFIYRAATFIVWAHNKDPNNECRGSYINAMNVIYKLITCNNSSQ